jgi:hypothetical protein
MTEEMKRRRNKIMKDYVEQGEETIITADTDICM